MLNHQALQQLSTVIAPENSQIVSLYLGVDLATQTKDAIKLTARALLKEAEATCPETVEKIDQYLMQQHEWQKPGLVIFACHEAGFFRTYSAQTPFRNRIRIGKKPYLKPLAHLLDYYANYGVVLADKIGAKFFHFHLGDLLQTAGIMGEEVRKLKTGQGSSATGMRGGQGSSDYSEEVARNLRQSAEAVTKFFAKRQIRRLFLGGASDTIAQFRDLLPKQLQAQIAGTFPISMDVAEHEVRQHTLTLLGEANANRERQLVEELITNSAKGIAGVTGLSDTLQAVSTGRVQTLILSDGFRAEGYHESTSGLLSLATTDNESSWEAVSDIIELAVEQAISYGGHIEVITNNPQLEQAGRIGALLRY